MIYPVDFRQVGHITDDEMHRILVKPLQPGTRLTAIFDSCHSGTALDLPYIYSTQGILKEPNLAKEAGQGLLGVIASYSQGDIGGMIKKGMGFFKKATGGEDAHNRTIATKTSPADVIMLSGSKDDQTSYVSFLLSILLLSVSWLRLLYIWLRRDHGNLGVCLGFKHRGAGVGNQGSQQRSQFIFILFLFLGSVLLEFEDFVGLQEIQRINGYFKGDDPATNLIKQRELSSVIASPPLQSHISSRAISYCQLALTPANLIIRADATIAAQATGAMSWAFITALKKNPQQSYVQLLNSIRDELASKYSQRPQLSSSHPLSESHNGHCAAPYGCVNSTILTMSSSSRYKPPLRDVGEPVGHDIE